MAASRMNGVVVMFLDSIDKVLRIAEQGINVRNTYTHTTIFPLVNPVKKDEIIERELSRHGQVVWVMKMITSGCKLPRLKHVMSFRRQVFMVLNDLKQDLKIAMKFHESVDGFDHTIFASSESMKCFRCGQEGHTVHNCSRPTCNSLRKVGK
ncbi:hypothetical protein LDENG_00243640 [Lucifuga dentata]|nr:hypothetical protein LDENG_00243640 [Lucifuga dentata]